jgi:hypothetical protein
VARLDQNEADRISIMPKIIKGNVVWQLANNGYKLSVNVIAPDISEILKLVGVKGRTNHSFSLLYKNDPIRRYCDQGIHTDPNKVTFRGPHKRICLRTYRYRFHR